MLESLFQKRGDFCFRHCLLRFSPSPRQILFKKRLAIKAVKATHCGKTMRSQAFSPWGPLYSVSLSDTVIQLPKQSDCIKHCVICIRPCREYSKGSKLYVFFLFNPFRNRAPCRRLAMSSFRAACKAASCGSK